MIRDQLSDGLLARNLRVLQVKELDEVDEIAFEPFYTEEELSKEQSTDFRLHYNAVKVISLEKSSTPSWLGKSKLANTENPGKLRVVSHEETEATMRLK